MSLKRICPKQKKADRKYYIYYDFIYKNVKSDVLKKTKN